MGATEDECGHQFAVACANIPFVPIRLARPRVLRGPKHAFLGRNGMNEHEQPRSVPLVPMLFGEGSGGGGNKSH